MTDGVVYDDLRARRNAMVLAVAQALYGATTTMQVIMVGNVGSQIAPDKAWATLPMSFFVIGTAVTTFPLSLLMKTIGRRNGFVIGALGGFIGCIMGVVAIYSRNFPLFVAGSAMLGLFQASASYYRFAAADLASPALRPKVISWVMTGGIVAALIGSLAVMATADLLAPVTFAGGYAAMAVLSLLTLASFFFLDFPAVTENVVGETPARPLAVIASQPTYIVAATTGMLSYGVMLLVMTATPVAMLGCGFSVDDSSWVIQWHALAMFVPSFFTGSIIARYGAERVAAVGMALLTAAGVSGLIGIHFGNFAVGVILLGLGWNFGYLGATTMLTSTYEPSERNKAQGLNDFLVFGANALASLAAGMLLAGWGWTAVDYAIFPMVVVALAMIGWLIVQKRKPVQAV